MQAEDAVGAEGLDPVALQVRLAHGVHGDEPVGLRPLRAAVQDRIEDGLVDRFGVVPAVDIHQVVGKLLEASVRAQLLQLADKVAQAQAGYEALLDLLRTVPGEHGREQEQREQERHHAAVQELFEAGNEEAELQHADQADDNADRQVSRLLKAVIHKEHDAGGQHGDGDGQPVDGGHALAAAEEDDRGAAEEPHPEVDRGDVFLLDGHGGVADFQRRQQVQADGLGDDGKGAVHHRLGGAPRGGKRQQQRRDAEGERQHLEEGVRRARAAGLPEHPRALAEVAEAEAQQHEGPGPGDGLPPGKVQVGVEDLGAGHGKEDEAEQRKAHGVLCAEQEAETEARVKGAQDRGGTGKLHGPRDADEQQPGQHDRAEETPGLPAAEVLEEEQRAQQHEHQHHNRRGAEPGEEAGRQRAAALHGGGQGQGGGQHGVGQQRGAAQRSREQDPPAAVQHQRVQGKVPAFAPVVRPEQQHDALHGRHQEEGPENQGKGAQHQRFADGRTAAAFRCDKLQHV